MTTQTITPPTTTRPPAPVVVGSSVAILFALVAGYGAIFFTGLGGWDADGVTFVTTYLAISVFAVASAVALLRGSSHGRLGLVCWGLFMVAFNIMKLVTIQEWSSTVFGVAGALVLAMALHPRTRRYTGEG